MAVVNCRECGKSVSTEAAACPHCGAPKPAPEVQAAPTLAAAEPAPAPAPAPAAAFKVPTWLKWLSGVVIVGAILSTCGEGTPTESAATTPTPAPVTPQAATPKRSEQLDFDVTPEQFRTAYNTLIREGTTKEIRALTMPPLKIEGGTFNAHIPGGTIYVMGTTSETTGKVRDMLIGYGGDGKAITAMKGMMISALMVRAGTGLSKESGAPDAVAQLLGAAAEQVTGEGKAPQARMIGGYRLGAVGIKDTGLMVTVSRPE